MAKAKDASRILMDFAWGYAIKGQSDSAKCQSYMNLACSAWNMFFLPKNELPQVVASFIDNVTDDRDYDGYEADSKVVEDDLYRLIELKNKKFVNFRYYFLSVKLHVEGYIVSSDVKYRDYDEMMEEFWLHQKVHKNNQNKPK